MPLLAQKILVVFVDGQRSQDAAPSSLPSAAFNDVAARGCTGFLVLPDADGSDLGALLAVQPVADGEGATIAYPKMPIDFFSSSEKALKLAKGVGLQSVHHLPETADDSSSPAATQISALLKDPENPKTFVFLHLDVSASGDLSADHWVHALLADLAGHHEEDGSDKFFLSLVQTCKGAVREPTAPHPLRPRQSYDKWDHKYPEQSAAARRRLMVASLFQDETRRDAVRSFDEAQIDALGGYGSMDARVYMKEMAFRLGFAPKYGA